MSTESSQPSGLETKLLRGAVQGRLFSREPAAVTLGRFVVLERLGRGGMGVVYAAYDPTLDRRVAVKVLHGSVTEHDASARRRLEREAQAMAKLSHPNVVTVHEVGTHDGQVFLAMEYVSGGTLLEWCEEHPPGDRARFEALLALLRQVAEGLAAAHAVGLVHRDLKPHNVLIQPRTTPGGTTHLRAMVGDFGLARLGAAAPSRPHTAEPAGSGSGESEAHLTQAGSAVGTPAYMAPEQFDGCADERSDQWGLCATFYEALYGELPFANSTWGAPVQVGADGPRQPTETHGVPSWMHRVLERGMAAEPAARFDNVQALLETIDRHTRPARRPFALGAALLGAGGLVGVAVTMNGGDSDGASVVPCDDGRAKLLPAVGDARKDEIRRAFKATGEPYWAETWDRLEVRLDLYADDWSAEYVDACEATRVRKAQTEETWKLRTICLDQLLEGLQLTSDAFAQAIPETVADAASISLSLPRPSECGESDRIRFAGGSLSLADADVARATGGIRRAAALSRLNRIDKAETELDHVEVVAESLGLHSLRAAALMLRATFARRRGDPEGAEQFAKDALALAEGAADLEAMARAWDVLAEIASKTKRNEESLFRAERALALADGAGLGGGLRGKFLSTKARALMGYVPIEEVVAIQEQALEELVASGSQPQFVVSASTDLAGDLVLAGQAERAVVVGRDALASAHELYADGHPALRIAQAQLAQTFVQGGQNAAAAELLDQALAAFPSTWGWDPSTRMAITSLRASVFIQLLQWDDARDLMDEALRKAKPVLPADDAEMRGARMMLAAILLETDEPSQALNHLEAIASYGDDKDVHPLNRGAYWGNLAEAQVRSGRRDEALRSLARSRAEYSQGAEAQSTWAFASLAAAAKIYGLAGEHAQSVDHYEQALAVADATPVDASDLAEALFGLARAIASSDPTRARNLARRAIVELQSIGDGAKTQTTEVERWLKSQ